MQRHRSTSEIMKSFNCVNDELEFYLENNGKYQKLSKEKIWFNFYCTVHSKDGAILFQFYY